MNRRGFLTGLTAALAAPAVIGSGVLMPLRGIVMPRSVSMASLVEYVPAIGAIDRLDILFGSMYARPEWAIVRDPDGALIFDGVLPHEFRLSPPLPLPSPIAGCWEMIVGMVMSLVMGSFGLLLVWTGANDPLAVPAVLPVGIIWAAGGFGMATWLVLTRERATKARKNVW